MISDTISVQKLIFSVSFCRRIDNIQYNQTQITPFNMLDGIVPITEGEICLYPANLTRGYEPNTKGNRITITFNVAL